MVQRRVGKRLRASLVIAGFALTGALTACSNGVEAGTLDPPSATGVRLDVGDLRIRNAVIVAGDDGELALSLTFVNAGIEEDTLTSVTLTDGDEPVEATMRPRSISLAPGAALVIPGEDQPRIEADADIAAGGYATVSMQFEHAGLVEVSLPVISTSSPHSGTDTGEAG